MAISNDECMCAARSDKLEGVVVRPAANLADLRAAAAVRAACFYTYPKDRSEMSTRTHRKMKLDQVCWFP